MLFETNHISYTDSIVTKQSFSSIQDYPIFSKSNKPSKPPKWITIVVNGGLGNQLYEIFTAISFSLKMNKPFFFVYEKHITGHASVRPTYWDNLLCKLNPCVVRDDETAAIRKHGEGYIHEEGHHYTPISIQKLQPDLPNVICLQGYFQSYKYFEHNFTYICELTGILERKQEFEQECKEKRLPIANISMHFRLGDYKHLTGIHPIMPYEYYRNALGYMLGETQTPRTVLFFCEKDDTDYVFEHYIQRLQQTYPQCEFILADQNLPDWKQLLYMSLCEHNIIANSTFSVWAAKLNENLNKQVCYPWIWFTDNYVRQDKRFVHDMFPPEWKKISWLFYNKDSMNYYV